MSSDDQDRRQRRRSHRWSAPSVGSVVTAAVVAYGTYRLATWVWNNWNLPQIDDDDDNEQLMEDTSRSTTRRSRRGKTTPSGNHHHPYAGNYAQNNRVSVQSYRLRRQRMDRCRGETIKAMEDFLPTLRRALEAATDASTESQELKRLKKERRSSAMSNIGTSNDEGTTDIDNNSQHVLQQKSQSALNDREAELWEVIKEQSVTRAVATAYAHTILFLVLTVQVNLLGGRLLEEQMNSNKASSSSTSTSSSHNSGEAETSTAASDRIESYQTSHRTVLLKTYEFFFDRGITGLVKTVRRAVNNVMADILVSDPSSLHITRETFDRIIHEIRDELEGRASSTSNHAIRMRSRRNQSLNLLRFLLPPEATLETTITDEVARSILDETWDLLESPVLEDAQRDCLGVTFELMRDHGWGNMFAAEAYDESQQSRCCWTTKPLANVVIQLKNVSKTFFEQGLTGGEFSAFGPRPVVNEYLGAMEMLPSVLELADVSFGA